MWTCVCMIMCGQFGVTVCMCVIVCQGAVKPLLSLVDQDLAWAGWAEEGTPAAHDASRAAEHIPLVISSRRSCVDSL